ncbi:97_t:CDS:2 [Ambispora gerdemannii]|uniref:97_t:CDS:1 n=1 Tax=Ambispora gerdemannii TaxID=144530 RepID=A0A9N8VIP6_9GLOM|nr:97_t:CDS:2 [Ambispora gerdemannii]
MISSLIKPIYCVLLFIILTSLIHCANATPITPTPSSNITLSSTPEVNNDATPSTKIPITESATDPEYSKTGARWLFGISFTMMQLNAIGSIYILYRTFRKWRANNYTRNSLSMALRVPFYIAISDLCLYVAHIFNQGYTVLNGRTWPGLSCKIVGGTVFFFVAVNMILVGVIALSTYLRVCRRIIFDFGPFDRNLFAIVLGFPLILTLGSIPSFGPSIYWCYTNKTNHIVSIITLILNFAVIALNIFCYYFTLREINITGKGFVNVRMNKEKIGNSNGNNNKSKINAATIERKVTQKIAGYILIFTIQWTPAMPYVIASVFTSPSVGLYLLCDIAINLGGIGNAIQYVLNEGWSLQIDDVVSKTNDNSSFATSPLPSARSPHRFTFNHGQDTTITSFAAIQDD